MAAAHRWFHHEMTYRCVACGQFANHQKLAFLEHHPRFRWEAVLRLGDRGRAIEKTEMVGALTRTPRRTSTRLW